MAPMTPISKSGRAKQLGVNADQRQDMFQVQHSSQQMLLLRQGVRLTFCWYFGSQPMFPHYVRVCTCTQVMRRAHTRKPRVHVNVSSKTFFAHISYTSFHLQINSGKMLRKDILCTQTL